MDDRDIIKLYLRRDEEAIAETRRQYGRYCHSIALRITGSEQDAEELVNDACLKAWNTIPPHDPESLKAYVGMLTRRLAVNRLEENRAAKRSGNAAAPLEELAECLPDREAGRMPESVALRDSLDRFVKTLSRRDRRVFLQRYWYACSVAEVAADCGMTVSHVTVVLLRLRKKLKAHLEKEGFSP